MSVPQKAALEGSRHELMLPAWNCKAVIPVLGMHEQNCFKIKMKFGIISLSEQMSLGCPVTALGLDMGVDIWMCLYKQSVNK